MKNLRFLSVLVLAVGTTVYTGCKDDDEVPIVGVSFESATQETTESNGTLASFHPDLKDILEDDQYIFQFTGADGTGKDVPVKLIFDGELQQQAVLKFTVGGTATDINEEDTDNAILVNDFEIVATGENLTVSGDEITINPGVSEASIIIRLFEDFEIEGDEDFEDMIETIQLSITSVVSGPVTLGTQTSFELEIVEDDAIFWHWWYPEADPTIEGSRTIDMDMFAWYDNRVVSYSVGETSPTSNPAEYIILNGGFPEGDYGLSYVYRGGDADSVIVVAEFYGNSDGEFYPIFSDNSNPEPGEDYLVYADVYRRANLNSDLEANTPLIVQTMEKEGVSFNDITAIQVPDTLSRKATNRTPRLKMKPGKIDPRIFLKSSVQHSSPR